MISIYFIFYKNVSPNIIKFRHEVFEEVGLNIMNTDTKFSGILQSYFPIQNAKAESPGA